MAIDISQSYSKQLMIALGIIFLIIPTLFTALRLAAKKLGRKGITLDDHFAVAAWTFNIACCICLIIAAVDGQLGQHQRVDSEGQPILDDPHFLIYEKTKFAVNMLAILGLGFSKLSILTLYINIFTVRSFKIATYTVMGFVAVWTISFFFSNLFTCVPVTALVEPFYGNKCLDSISMWLASVVTDVILDVTILVMPMPLIAGLQLRPMQKLGVASMFLLGGGICAISLVRLLVYFQIGAQFALHFNDETYYTSPIFFWAVIELALACICAALPTLRPLYLYFYPTEDQTSARRHGKGYRIPGKGQGPSSSKFSMMRKRSPGHSHFESLTDGHDDVELNGGLQTTIGRSTSDTAPDMYRGGIVVERTIEQTSRSYV